MTKILAKTFGLGVGISSGAAYKIALKLSNQYKDKKRYDLGFGKN